MLRVIQPSVILLNGVALDLGRNVIWVIFDKTSMRHKCNKEYGLTLDHTHFTLLFEHKQIEMTPRHLA
jgi:hypothetical protein